MSADTRNPQLLNGEMFPRNHYLGLESVRQLHEFVTYFNSQGINLMAIPTINEVAAGLLDEDFEAGTILGVATPLDEDNKDKTQVVVWDGYGVVALSILMYFHKQSINWKLVGEEGYQKPDFGHIAISSDAEVVVKPSGGSYDTSTKHQKKSREKGKNPKKKQRSFY